MQLLSDIIINEYSVIPQKISFKELQQKSLLLVVSLFQDEIELSVTEYASNNVYLSASYILQQKKFSHNEINYLITDFVHRYHLNQLAFQSVHIIYSSPYFVLCPIEFYLPDKKQILLEYAHPVSVLDEQVLTDDFQNIKIIYSIRQSIYTSLTQIFPSAKLFHSSTALLNLFFYHPMLMHGKFWIHLHPNYMEIMAKNEQQLLMYNMFDTQTSIDVLYYTLFCIQQLNFDSKTTDVYVSGNVSSQHSIFKILPKYVHSVQILHHHPKLHILPLDSNLISHYHFITLNHPLCVSYQENTKAEK